MTLHITGMIWGHEPGPADLRLGSGAMTGPAPWTVLDSMTTFADPWLRILSDRVIIAELGADGLAKPRSREP